MGAMDEDGTQMTPQQLHDETMTLFLAGHETTAQMLSWTWYALSGNPEAEEKLHEELHGVLGGRAPGAEDFPRLPYLRAVMNEVLRLYPPAYILARETMEPCEIGGYEIHKGSTVVISQWIMHRDPRYYDDPRSVPPRALARRICRIACRPAPISHSPPAPAAASARASPCWKPPS